jgi:hypothetical protein
MNTKNRQDQKHPGQKTRPKQRPKTQGRSSNLLHDDRKYHEQERPETRMFR